MEGSAETPTSPPSPDAVVEEPPERLQSVLRIFGSVVAPTTLLTALLIYFGRLRTQWFFDHFGIHSSLLGFTTQDYVADSVDALFVPLAAGLSLGLVVLWLHAWLAPRLSDGPDPRGRLRRMALGVAVPGLLLFATGMAGMLIETLRTSYSYVFPFSLAAGTVLLLYASRLQRRLRAGPNAPRSLSSVGLIEATGAFLLVALSLFWAASNYAGAVGTTRARALERSFRSALPTAVVFSKERLHFGDAGVQETLCADSESGYPFRYDGLYFLLRSAGQYLFLPDTWGRSRIAIVIPEGDSVRLQFQKGGSPERPPRSDEADVNC